MVKKAILFTTIATLLMAGLHAWVIYSTDGDWKYMYTYILLFVLSAGLFAFLGYIMKSDASKGGFAFIGGSTIQMFAFIVFMFPTLMNAGEDVKMATLHFMIPFLVYLGIEAFWAVRIISAKEK